MKRLAPLLLAVLVALGLTVAPPQATPVRAALPDLTIVTNARYDVDPETHRIHVTVDLTATNRLRDTATRRFYFDRAFLAVLPGTTDFRIKGGAGTPAVRVTQQTDEFNLLQITFGQRINAGQSARFQLTFDLPDPGGAPTRNVRVGSSLVSFPVWAFASDATPGSQVAVVFPPGFNIEAEAGTFGTRESDADGRTIFRSGPLDAPLEFFVYFVADRPATYTETSRRAVVRGGDVELTIRSWPDDPEWTERVGSLFERGLPVLAERIGLPWTRTEPLVVEEAVSRTTGGYAGLFDPARGHVEVAYYADAFVVLHEAAHAWFNGGLLADRWANEAFASLYAIQAAGDLGVEAAAGPLTDELRAASIPLNAWGVAGEQEGPTEDYAYAASLHLARLIDERAKPEALAAVWNAAAGRRAPYQPPGAGEAGGAPIERVTAAPDWRGLLDLLEEHTGEAFDDLWREWVVRPAEADLLEARVEARAEYGRVVDAAGDWQLPRSVREALRAWQFDDAATLLAEARGVLEQRTEVQQAAAAAGLELPPTLETAFESDGGFAAAAAEADAELATIDALEQAQASRLPNPDPIAALGLFGSNPDADLAEARSAFSRADLLGAVRAAADAQSVWLGAAEIGRNRLMTIAGLAILLALGILLVVSRWRRGRDTPDRASPDLAGPDSPPEALGG